VQWYLSTAGLSARRQRLETLKALAEGRKMLLELELELGVELATELGTSRWNNRLILLSSVGKTGRRSKTEEERKGLRKITRQR
jgi:hypothetical protein